jgi:hypothetical protein
LKSKCKKKKDLIIFPDEAEFTQVAQCETGRVYLLKFKSSNEHHFFWMQSKDASKDQEIVERVNGLIRDPESSMDNPAPFDDASQADMMRLLSSVDGQGRNGDICSRRRLFICSKNRSKFDTGEYTRVSSKHRKVKKKHVPLKRESSVDSSDDIRRDSSMVTSIESNASASNDSQEALDQLEDLISNAEAAGNFNSKKKRSKS